MKKNLLFIISLFIMLTVPIYVRAENKIEKVYTERKCSFNMDKSRCRNGTCTWINDLNCGITNIKNTEYTCYYWLEANKTENLVTAKFNKNGLSSITYETTDYNLHIAKINDGSTAYTKKIKNTEYYTCPDFLYSNNKIEYDKDTEQYTIVHYFGYDEDNYDTKYALLKMNYQDNNPLVMGIKNYNNNEVNSNPVKNPLSCDYKITVGKIVNKITVTYNSDNTISAICQGDCTGKLTVDASLLSKSQSFKDWKCHEGPVFSTVKGNEIKISFDKKDFGEDDAVHEYNPIPENNNQNNTENNNQNNTPKEEELYGCEVIPKVISKWLYNMLDFIKYCCLVLVIFLGILDFMKAAAANDEGAVNKAALRFMKRIIAVVALFLLPILIRFILNNLLPHLIDPDNPICTPK